MTIQILTPSAAVASNLSFPPSFNLSNEEERYASGKTKNQIILLPIKSDRSSFKLSISAEITTQGIVVSDKYNTHSLGISPSSPEDTDALSNMLDLFSSLSLDDYEMKPFFRDDTLWLRLKKNNNSYNFKSNTKLNPKKPSESELVNSQSITIIGDIKGYINLEEKFYGLTFQINELNIS